MKFQRFRNSFCLLVIFLSIVPFATLFAQSPDKIGGQTIELTISGGSPPFATNGSYHFLTTFFDNSYAIAPISGKVVPSFGLAHYGKTGADTAWLNISDSVVGLLSAECTFATPNSGTYVLKSTTSTNSIQFGTFVLYSAESPVSIDGIAIAITITSGASPFASSGSHLIFTGIAGERRYDILESPSLVSSYAFASYFQNSKSTGYFVGAFAFADLIPDSNVGCYLSFKSPTTGTVYMKKNGNNGYQTGTFVISKTRWITPVNAAASGYTVVAGKTNTGPGAFAIDGNLSTAWTLNGMGHIDFDLGSKQLIRAIEVTVRGFVSGGNTINIYVDGHQVLANQRSVNAALALYFPETVGRVIRYETVPGNTATWSEVGEFRALVEASPPAAPIATISRAVQVRWPTQPGVIYQPQVSSDLITWFDFGATVNGSGTESQIVYLTETPDKVFFRIQAGLP